MTGLSALRSRAVQFGTVNRNRLAISFENPFRTRELPSLFIEAPQIVLQDAKEERLKFAGEPLGFPKDEPAEVIPIAVLLRSLAGMSRYATMPTYIGIDPSWRMYIPMPPSLLPGIAFKFSSLRAHISP